MVPPILFSPKSAPAHSARQWFGALVVEADLATPASSPWRQDI
jgi:hypothetical protein